MFKTINFKPIARKKIYLGLVIIYLIEGFSESLISKICNQKYAQRKKKTRNQNNSVLY